MAHVFTTAEHQAEASATEAWRIAVAAKTPEGDKNSGTEAQPSEIKINEPQCYYARYYHAFEISFVQRTSEI